VTHSKMVILQLFETPIKMQHQLRYM